MFNSFDSSSADEGFSDEIHKVKRKLGLTKSITFLETSKLARKENIDEKVDNNEVCEIETVDMQRLIKQSEAHV